MWFFALFLVLGPALALIGAGAGAPRRAPEAVVPAPSQDAPRFTDDGRLVRPENHRTWVFVGSSFAMSYAEEGPARQNFHNVYIHPRAFEAFRRTGLFPEGTILMLETFSAASQAAIAREGHFQDRAVGLSAAVKDTARFQEGWAYFGFGAAMPSAAEPAKAFAKDACWSCHKKHAERDNVFVQFYPVLRDAAPAPARKTSR